MALKPGDRVGSYEVVSLLGAGGMGEVYRARDPRLGREVAIKVLPDSLASDPDRIARFQREAQLLASLNHPNIATIHGLEETTSGRALVMELVEGPTLADRIAQGPLPLDEALPIAKQIAEALETAHDRGVIHRDLKPANIKIKPDGKVKVLDFGLAKLVEASGTGTASGAGALSMSPTLSAHGTYAGVILGTAAYMSPEQARGKPVDRRADIWAFGCVLFEMLTGKKAFDSGETVSDAIAAILKNDPDWSLLPPETPTSIRTLLRRCLQKDPQKRLPQIGAARVELEDTSVGGQTGSDAATRGNRRYGTLQMTATGALALILGGSIAGTSVWMSTQPVSPRVARTTITFPEGGGVTLNENDRDLVLTPDGNRLVYVGDSGRQLFVRNLDAFEPAVLFAGEDSIGSGAVNSVRGVFTSPDGEWVGFFRSNSLTKVAITGGPAVTLVR